MAVNDMMSGGFDADSARYDRMNRTQPADFAPGQSAVFQQEDAFANSSVPNNNNMNDIFSTGLGDNSNPFGTNPFGSPMGQSMGMGGIPTGNSMNPNAMPQQPQQGMSQEDKFWNAAGQGFKESISFSKDLIASVKMLTPRWYSEWGRVVTIVGLIVGGIGLVLKLFGLSFGFQLTIGGLLSSAGGILIWFLNTENAKGYNSKYKDENNTNQTFNQPLATEPAMSSGMSSGFDTFGDSSDNFGGDFNSSFASEDSWGSDEGFEDEPYDTNIDDGEDYGEYVEDTPQEGMSTEEAFNTLQEVPQGIYVRKYLWDAFTKVLPTMKPSFSTIKSIDEDDDAFLNWEDKLREAASVAGCKEDYLPDLLQLQENLFTIIVTCSRPTGFKPELVANELANIYAYSGGEKNANVFASVDTIGERCRITIFNGAAAMISLKDMMLQEESWIMDTSNYIPVILGVDQLGKCIKADFKKLESIIITGMPRSGKSWFVQAVLTQMCAFVPPSELNIIVCDPKEGISDFKGFTLPHVKKFVSGDDNIVKTLRDLVKIEAPKRKKIIGDADNVNIWDFKERYPDVHLPVVYVVVDEVVTLASRMDKETNNEFRMLLRELISQLPALGIRAFLIPHVLNNDIIEKKTSDLVPCKISVCGDADHIEKATGSKPKDFPYKLVHKGDMAIKLTGVQNTLYVHGPALTDSNVKNNELFDYLRRVWSKLEPDEVVNSVAAQAETKMANKKAMESVLNDTQDDSNNSGDVFASTEAFSNPNEQGLSGMNEFALPEDDNTEFNLF